MRSAARMFPFVTCFLLAAAAAVAQDAVVAGVVRDTGGGVLPGVTVEASSPSLIEKSRSIVTDGAGIYRIIALVPGTYTVTFSLEGFSRLERQGIEVRAATTVPVNAELQVGTVSEMITVAGASPIVDTQTVSAVTVMTREIIDNVPLQRNIQTLGILIPGTGLQTVGGSTGRDVGGSAQGEQTPLSYRGSTNSIAAFDGMRTGVLAAGGQFGSYANDGAVQEISYSTGADSAEMAQAGLLINVIPKEGGNTFKGSVAANWTGGDAWNGNNLDDRLRALGLTDVSHIRKIYDLAPAYGGPIKRDRLWFFGAARVLGTDKTIVDTYFDADPNPYRYTPDLDRPAINDDRQTDLQLRLTMKLNDRNKLTGFIDKPTKYRGHYTAGAATTPPEARVQQVVTFAYVGNLKWMATLTPRLLLESGYGVTDYRYARIYEPQVQPTDFTIVDQILNRTFNAAPNNLFNESRLETSSSKLTWVTGRNSLSGGVTVNRGPFRARTVQNGQIAMRFGNTTVNADANGYGPNQVTLVMPTRLDANMQAETGFWVSNKLTYKRATITTGLRYDWFLGEVLESSVLPSVWSAGVTYPKEKNTPNWKDLSPRLGVAYDLFGHGRTVVKASVSKYVDAQTVAFATSANPLSRLTGSQALTWTDNSGDFTIFNPDGSVQDIDFNPRAPIDPRTGLPQNELAPLGGSTFGQLVPNTTRVDPAIREGFGVRGYSWEYSVSLQQEILPRVAAGVNYYRRPTNANMLTTDNVNLGPQDFVGPYCITTPVDPRLANGGGWQLCDIYQRTQAAQDRAVDNIQTFTTNLLEGTGLKPEVYNHGFDVTVSARTTHGLTVQGGINADRSVNDSCYRAVFDSPQMLQKNPVTGELFCRAVTPFRPDYKLLASQQLPWWGLQVSGTYQRTQGPLIQATWTVTQANANAAGWAIATTSGSTPAQIAAATTTFNLFSTGQAYAPPLNQLDLRLAKRVTLGRQRLLLNVDLYNVTNSNWVITQNTTFGTGYIVSPQFLRPTDVLQARVFKIGGQLDF